VSVASIATSLSLTFIIFYINKKSYGATIGNIAYTTTGKKIDAIHAHQVMYLLVRQIQGAPDIL
jgi:hypothetical protein